MAKTPARLYVRVAVVGIWSLVVGLIGVIVAGGILSALPEGGESSPGSPRAGLAVVPLLAPAFGGLFDAGVSSIGAGAVLLAGGLYLCRTATYDDGRRRSTRL